MTTDAGAAVVLIVLASLIFHVNLLYGVIEKAKMRSDFQFHLFIVLYTLPYNQSNPLLRRVYYKKDPTTAMCQVAEIVGAFQS